MLDPEGEIELVKDSLSHEKRILPIFSPQQRGIYHRSEMTRERYDRLRLLGFDFSWQRPDLKGNTLGKRFDEKVSMFLSTHATTYCMSI